MTIDFQQILNQAEKYRPEISRFLRDMIAIPSESTQEELAIQRIKEEMEKVGFDKIEIDEMGNIYGTIGHGSHVIAMDAHIDTVGVGNLENWKVDPYEGYEDDEIIMGRGASDQEGGMASMVYAGKIIKDLGLEADYTLVITGTVQEEDCDGLCWQYIMDNKKIQPEFVVSTEPTSCRIYRGQRGRMEIKVTTSGISAHGSAPERGDNAIYKMAPILLELQELNTRLADHDFLGKGTLTVSEVFFTSPSRCAVADGCSISVDRRLTVGETADSAMDEIKNLPSVKAGKAMVEMYDYERPSYTGFSYRTEAYFPTWLIEKDHVATTSLADAYKGLFNEEPVVDKWTFSTNGVAIMGKYGVPCIGFGPGAEEEAHAPNEKTWKDHLVKAAAMYAAIPLTYLKRLEAK
ncbi:MAG: YgeY family selenium metabolism-linked hydrolase [Candidatus Marinimicrobia bacterium]|jgi:putative selenium metabolism hydrolase|nr:YgeY family selenium metabolism-linked hydrolase [Candidatus Neomarinimicrobiota bacterium]MBT4361834.1 YgeY family selenium metabolism-linked hydrolase [Candidatus Neomarinimicrobiota bacterium]MBT4714410.1 YgeY family selenium metabolism-linked hydrolase [Candidatus Neomarinimicrobiota bacterium]MBT4946111.1 YgeY family selenium metabolism-linked hydrolase [Candidatus Neomarinimicrobiota bacterium]MBT5268910.1 YgeY family selenium metabolism-linked hydrolase [Candidatus Neomarinimicrobiota